MTLQARLLYRGDPRKPHLPVDTLAGTAEFRLQQMVVTVQAQGGWFNPKFCINSVGVGIERSDNSAAAG